MSALADLTGMWLLLRQGRLAARLSLGLLLVALLLLALLSAPTPCRLALLLSSALAGLVQIYYALRVELDVSLLDVLREEGLQGEAAARRVDQLLHDCGLRRQPSTPGVRSWQLRWAGMRRLLLRQYLVTALQTLLLLLAVLWRLM